MYRVKESIVDDTIELIVINFNSNNDESTEDKNKDAERTSEEELEFINKSLFQLCHLWIQNFMHD